MYFSGIGFYKTKEKKNSMDELGKSNYSLIIWEHSVPGSGEV